VAAPGFVLDDHLISYARGNLSGTRVFPLPSVSPDFVTAGFAFRE
jgi:hypothetical protein